MVDGDPLIPKHGGYRRLKSFQVSQILYDMTVRFCDRFLEPRSRTREQMIQAARSGVQNIAEGSLVSGTSKKMELKLTNVARASLEELRLDFEDFLRQRGLLLWERDDTRRVDLIARRPRSADDVAIWARDARKGASVHREGPKERASQKSTSSIQSTPSTSSDSEIAANGALALIAVACSLLDRQLAAQAKAFEKEGGFTERLYERRQTARNNPKR